MTQRERELLRHGDAELDRVLVDLNDERREIRLSSLTLVRVVERNVGGGLGSLLLIATSTGYYASFSGAPNTVLIVKGRLTGEEKAQLAEKCQMEMQGSDAPTIRLHLNDINRSRVRGLTLTFGLLTLAACLFAVFRMIPGPVRAYFGLIDVDQSQSGFDSFFQTAPMMTAGAAALYLTVFTLYSGMHQERMEHRNGVGRGLKGLVEQDALLLRWCLVALACSSLGYLLAMSPDPLLWLVTLPDMDAPRNGPLLVLAILRGLTASLLVTLGTVTLVPPFHDLIHFLVGRNIDHLALKALGERHDLLKQHGSRDTVARESAPAEASAKPQDGQGSTAPRPAVATEGRAGEKS